MRQSRTRVIGLLVLVCVATVGACTATPASPFPRESTQLSGQLTFAGSTSLQPLVARLADAYSTEHPNVQFDIAAGGSRVGIAAIHDGTVDIGMASRDLTPDEREGTQVHQVATDVIATIVHGGNGVSDVSVDQLCAIYSGVYRNWSELGGVDAPIVVLTRASSSGTRGAFDSIVLKGQTLRVDAQVAVTAGDMAAGVKSQEGAIGYVGFGNIESGLCVLSVNGVPPSLEAVQDGSYPITRPLLLLTGPLSQPLAETYVDYALSDAGQQIVAESGWAPVR